MSKYIKAEVLKNNIHKLVWTQDMKSVEKFVDMLPAADVQEIRRGKWEWHSEDTCFYCCSNCGHNAYGNTGEILSGYYNFCPNCGAQMDLDETYCYEDCVIYNRDLNCERCNK